MRPDHRQALLALGRDLALRGRVPETLTRFRRTAELFLDGTQKPLAQIDVTDVREFLASGAARGIAATSQAAMLVHLRALFRALAGAGLVQFDPTEGVVVQSQAHPPQLVLSPSMLDRLLETALVPVNKGPHGVALALRTRACLELLYGVGVRACEAGRVLVADLSLADGLVSVRPAKRGETRTLPLPKAALLHIDRYVREGRPVLTRPDGREGGHLLVSYAGRPLGPREVGVVVHGVARRAGVKATPHAFRRSLATDLARSGVGLEVVRQVLGHRSLSHTAGYVAVGREELREAVERLDRRPRADPHDEPVVHVG